MLEAQMPEAGLLRLSFETYANDELWRAGFKNAMIQHENHEEDKRVRHGKGECSGRSISRKTQDRASTKSNQRPPKRDTAEKRGAYQGKPKVPTPYENLVEGKDSYRQKRGSTYRLGQRSRHHT